MGPVPPASLEDCSTAIAEWVRATIGANRPVHFAPIDADGVHVWLLAIERLGGARHAHRADLRFRLRYLISCLSAEEPLAAQNELGRLLVAASDHGVFRAGAEAVEPATWLGFGLAPRPAFVLEVPWLVERALPTAPRARELRVGVEGLDALHGTVVGTARGSGDTTIRAPLAGAVVRAPALGKRTVTGPGGRFTLEGLPVSRPLTLEVSARGIEHTFSWDPGTERELTVELDMDGATT